MWSIAVYDLRLTTEQFESLTPGQFSALIDRHENETKVQSYRFGVLVATVRNMFRGKSDKPVTPLEVMGYTEEDEGRVPVSKETGQQEIALRFRLGAAIMNFGRNRG